MGFVGIKPAELLFLSRRCGEAGDELDRRRRLIEAELNAAGAASSPGVSAVGADLVRIEAWLRGHERSLHHRAAAADARDCGPPHRGWGLAGHVLSSFGRGVRDGAVGMAKGAVGLVEMAEHDAELPDRVVVALAEHGPDGLVALADDEIARQVGMVKALGAEAIRLGDLANRLGPAAPFYLAADTYNHGVDAALSHLAYGAGTLIPDAVIAAATMGAGEATTAEARAAEAAAAATEAPALPETFADLPEPAGWGDPETLEDHLNRHPKRLGIERDEYIAEAQRLLREAREGQHVVRVDPTDGAVRVFDRDRGIFGAFNRDGSIKTLYPERRAYFDRQEGAELRR